MFENFGFYYTYFALTLVCGMDEPLWFIFSLADWSLLSSSEKFRVSLSLNFGIHDHL